MNKIPLRRYQMIGGHNEWRDRAHRALGSICVRCGFSDWRALQIDHVNGDGWADRKDWKSGSHGSPFFRSVIESINRGENKYQLLCANCNWIKKHENKERRNQYELELKRTCIDDDDCGPLFSKR